ncbi:MAG: hypothetical protein ACP5U0_06915 [Caldisphaera sp.]
MDKFHNFSQDNNFLIYLIIIFSSFLFTSLNQGGPYIIHWIDISWPFNPQQSIQEGFYAYTGSDYGYISIINIFNLPPVIIIYLLTLLEIPVYIQQIILFSSLELLAGIFYFKIFKNFIFKDYDLPYKNLILLSSTIFITLGPANFYFWDYIPNGLFLMAFGSIFLYYEMKILNSYLIGDSVRGIDILLLFVASALSFSANVPFNLSLVLLTLIFPIYILSRNNFNFKKVIYFFTFILFIIIFSNLWWIIPSYYEQRLIPNVIASGGQPTLYVSMSFYNVIRLLYNPGNLPYSKIVNFIYHNIGGAVTYFLFPLLVISTFLVSKRRMSYYLTLAIYLILIMLFMGFDGPMGKFIYSLLYNGILNIMFRNTETSFYFSYMVINDILISFAIFEIFTFYKNTKRKKFKQKYYRPSITFSFFEIAVSIRNRQRRKFKQTDLRRRIPSRAKITLKENDSFYVRLPKRNYQKIFAATSSIIIIFLAFSIAPQNFLGDMNPHYPDRSRMLIPTYEYDVAAFLDLHAQNSYALLYPGGFLEQNWTHGYDAYDILPSLTRNALLITHNGQYIGQSYNWIIDYIYNYIGSPGQINKTLSDIMYSADIKYIVIEGEVGGNYPFGFYAPPDYNMILNKLNETPHLRLDLKVGPDYIYENTLDYNGLISVATSLKSNYNILNGYVRPILNLTNGYFKSDGYSYALSGYVRPILNLTNGYFKSDGYSYALSGYVMPILNISHEYYNYSKSTAPNMYIVNSTYSNGINIYLNKSYKSYLQNLSLPYGVIYSNEIPLRINTSEYQYLIIKIKANRNTAFSIAGLSSEILNSTNLQNSSNYLPLIPNDNYGWSNDPVIEKDYGGDHFYSNNTTMEFVISLTESAGRELNYLVFGIGPVADNGSGLRGVPVGNWPGNQSITIESINLGNSTPLSSVDSSYLNSTYIPLFSNMYIVNSTYSNGINIYLNKSYKSYLQNLSLPYGVIYSNEIPLRINTSEYQYLIIKIKANRNTAFSIAGLSSEILNSTNLQNSSNYLPLIPNDNYGWSNDPVIEKDYGGDHFYSNNTTMEFVISLTESAGRELNYLVFGIGPVADNGSGLRGVPVGEWPNEQNIDIEGIYLGQIIDPSPGEYFGMENLTLDSNASINYKEITPSSYNVIISKVSGYRPILIVFHQSYSKFWTVSSGSGFQKYELISLDNITLGIIVYPDKNSSVIIFDIYFTPQHMYSTIMELLLLIYTIFLIFIIIFEIERRRRIDSL